MFYAVLLYLRRIATPVPLIDSHCEAAQHSTDLAGGVMIMLCASASASPSHLLCSAHALTIMLILLGESSLCQLPARLHGLPGALTLGGGLWRCSASWLLGCGLEAATG